MDELLESIILVGTMALVIYFPTAHITFSIILDFCTLDVVKTKLW